MVPVFASDKLPTSREIFSNLYTQGVKTTPPQFSASLKSKLVAAQLKRIPKDKLVFGKTPHVRFVFKQGKGFKIIIEHVDEYYKNMFALYEDILEQSGLYLVMGKKNTYSKFIGHYRLYWLKGEKNLPHTLKIIEKDALPGDYGIFYATKDWKIQQSEYYEDNKKVAELLYEYSFQSNYTVVSNLTLNILKPSKKRKVEFKFEAYDFSEKSIKGAFD